MPTDPCPIAAKIRRDFRLAFQAEAAKQAPEAIAEHAVKIDVERTRLRP